MNYSVENMIKTRTFVKKITMQINFIKNFFENQSMESLLERKRKK